MYYYGREPSSDFFMHYGVKGMKWGVRRYQKVDGTLTSAGKKKAENNIKKLTSLKKGPERDRIANSFLKEFSAMRENRYQRADAAYNNALKNKNRTNPRYAYVKALDKYDKTSKGAQYIKEADWIHNEIITKSGNWYNGEGVSKGFKNYLNHKNALEDAYEKRRKELGVDKYAGNFIGRYKFSKIEKKDKVLKDITSRSDKLDDDLLGVVLNDINFPDNLENRRRIRHLVFSD